MFMIMIVLIALTASAWTTWRISHMIEAGWLKRLAIFMMSVLVWLIPILIRDRGLFSGTVYTIVYYLLYFIFIWNFFYFAFAGIRDALWGMGHLWRRLCKRPLGAYNFFRKDFLFRSSFWLICLAFWITGYSLYCGVKTPEVRQTTIITDKIKSNMKIVALTDLHLNRVVSVSKIKNIVDKVNSLSPDMIVFVGDTIDDYEEYIRPHLTELSYLHAPKGKYAVSGNHEFYTGHAESKKALQKGDITYLFNEGVQVTPEVYLAGIPDNVTVRKISDSADLSRALFSAEDKYYKILLSHRPNYIDTILPGQIDLQISGHTHGAQIFPMHILVKWFNNYLAGLYDTPNGLLYVSRGSGQWGPQMRFLAPSEITVINLDVDVDSYMKSDFEQPNVPLTFVQPVKKAPINKNKAVKTAPKEKPKKTVSQPGAEKPKKIVPQHRTENPKKTASITQKETKEIPNFPDMLEMTDPQKTAQMVASVDNTKLLPLKPNLLKKLPPKVEEKKISEPEKKEIVIASDVADERAFEEAKASLEADLNDIIANKKAAKVEKDVTLVDKQKVAIVQETTDLSEKKPQSVNVESEQKAEIKAEPEPIKTETEKSPIEAVKSDLPKRDDLDSETIIVIDNRPLIPTVKVYDGNSQEKIADSTVKDAHDVQTKTVQNADGSSTTTEIITEVKRTSTGHATRRTVRVVTSYPEKPVDRGNLPAVAKTKEKAVSKQQASATQTTRVYSMAHPVYGAQYVVAPQPEMVNMAQPVTHMPTDMMYPIGGPVYYNAMPVMTVPVEEPMPLYPTATVVPVYEQPQGAVWYYPTGY